MNQREVASRLARKEGLRKSSLNAAQAAEVLKLLRDDFELFIEMNELDNVTALLYAVTGRKFKFRVSDGINYLSARIDA